MWEAEPSRGFPVPRLRTIVFLAVLGAAVWAAWVLIEDRKTGQALFDRKASSTDRIRSVEYWAGLGRHGLPQLIEGLNHPDAQVRRSVVAVLQRLGKDAQDAAPALARRLRDENPRVRAGAISALQRMGMIEAVRADLERLLGDEDIAVRNATGEALLRSRGAAAASDLAKVTQSTDPLIRVRAVRLLSKLADELCAPPYPEQQQNLPLHSACESAAGVAEAVRPLLRDESAEVRREAHRVLLDLSALTLDESTAALRDSDGTVVEIGLEMLRHHPEMAVPAVPEIAALLKRNAPMHMDFLRDVVPFDPSWRELTVRDHAVATLAAIGPPAKAVVPELVRVLADADEFQRLSIAEALIQIGAERDAITPTLVELTLSGGALCESAAMLLLGYDPRAAEALVPVMAERLKWNDPLIREMAAGVLIELAPVASTAVPSLIESLGDPEWVVRSAAAAALAAQGPRASSAVPALLAQITAHGAPGSTAVIYALGAIGPAAAPAVPELLTIAGEESVYYLSPRREAIRALGRIGTANEEVLALLRQAAADESAWTRIVAIEALGRLGADRPEVVEFVSQAIQDRDGTVRGEAIRALVRLSGNVSARVEALRRALDDGHSHVRLLAVFALARIGTEAEVVLPNLRALRTDPASSVEIPEPYLLEEDWPAAFGPKRAISVGDAAAAAIELIENADAEH